MVHFIRSRTRARRSQLLMEAMEPRLLLSGLHEYPTGVTQPLTVAVAADNTVWVGAAADAGQPSVLHLSAGGAIIGSYAVGDSVTDLAIAPDGNVWFVDANTDFVNRLNPTTGNITSVDLSLSAVIITHIAVGGDGNVWITDAGNAFIGPQQQPVFDPTISRIDPNAMAVNETINLGHQNTTPTALKISGDNIWVALGGSEVDLADASNNITPTFGDSAYVHLSASAGTLTSYVAPLPSSELVDLQPATDGSLWLAFDDNINRAATIEQEAIYHVTFNGAGTPDYSHSVQFDDSVAAHFPAGLTLGTDGTLYFEQQADKAIDSLNPTTFAVANVVTVGDFPSSLVLGPASDGTPNGGLWFAEGNAGLVASFDLPVSNPVTPVVASGVSQINQVQNVALPQTTLATFTGPGVAGNYTATINWGDGSPVVTGTVSAQSSGGFKVVAGGKSYASTGQRTITIVITNTVTAQTATATTLINVTATPITITSFNATPLVLRIALVTATFTASLSATTGDFKVTINWGDGSSDSGAILKISNGNFALLDLHQYKKKGTFTVSLEIDPLDGIAASPVTEHITLKV